MSYFVNGVSSSSVRGTGGKNVMDSTPAGKKSSPASGFGDKMAAEIKKVNEYQLQADAAAEAFVAGENVELHEVMVAMEKADLSLRLAMQVRNKLMESYTEIMHMQV